MTNINIKRRFQEQELPDMKTLQAEVDKIAGQVTIGETLFMKKHGVKSEGEYKKKMAAPGPRDEALSHRLELLGEHGRGLPPHL